LISIAPETRENGSSISLLGLGRSRTATCANAGAANMSAATETTRAISEMEGDTFLPEEGCRGR
jgi:hypothetical protein